jgi:two-component system response regulator MprA
MAPASAAKRANGGAAVRVLVVDDEPGVRESVSGALRFAGYDVSVADDGVAALDLVRTEHPDAMVLDLMMPRMDGLATCRALRAEGHRLPVIMITARDSERDRDAGLTAGADDYLVKPFAVGELVARLRALVRRASPGGLSGGLPGGLALRAAGRLLIREARRVTLSPTEYRIVEALLERPVSRAALLDRVWGYDFGGSAVLEAYLGSVARKLEALGCGLAGSPDGWRITG